MSHSGLADHKSERTSILSDSYALREEIGQPCLSIWQGTAGLSLGRYLHCSDSAETGSP
jgi:hypothetical protein